MLSKAQKTIRSLTRFGMNHEGMLEAINNIEYIKNNNLTELDIKEISEIITAKTKALESSSFLQKSIIGE